MNAFELALKALKQNNVNNKIKLVDQLHSLKEQTKLNYQAEYPIRSVKAPGRPKKPNLVRFQNIPKRDKSDLGFIKTIHAICHIEFNAINLALDALYRFRDMPDTFYQDWIQVAFEESQHFQLLNNYLAELGYHYGDFDAHNGLWKMTHETDYDVLARMALVPRVLEARGLDATPKIQARFKKSKFVKMVDILQVIFNDEIGHVKIGNTWFHKLCQQRNLDPIQTFDQLVQKHIGESLRGPFNIEARKLADFSDQELDYLQAK
ncbi:MAG: ferritin-like domain-containing protein [Candidatus Ruthia sp.]|nr:ferritin-like domain-containing protein [Candidatus Ruthturnera sp.]MBT4667963.1 ferritin-like domain-containing protein [Candidatus Ruthturnera sp.]